MHSLLLPHVRSPSFVSHSLISAEPREKRSDFHIFRRTPPTHRHTAWYFCWIDSHLGMSVSEYSTAPSNTCSSLWYYGIPAFPCRIWRRCLRIHRYPRIRRYSHFLYIHSGSHYEHKGLNRRLLQNIFQTYSVFITVASVVLSSLSSDSFSHDRLSSFRR